MIGTCLLQKYFNFLNFSGNIFLKQLAKSVYDECNSCSDTENKYVQNDICAHYIIHLLQKFQND